MNQPRTVFKKKKILILGISENLFLCAMGELVLSCAFKGRSEIHFYTIVMNLGNGNLGKNFSDK